MRTGRVVGTSPGPGQLGPLLWERSARHRHPVHWVSEQPSRGLHTRPLPVGCEGHSAGSVASPAGPNFFLYLGYVTYTERCRPCRMHTRLRRFVKVGRDQPGYLSLYGSLHMASLTNPPRPEDAACSVTPGTVNASPSPTCTPTPTRTRAHGVPVLLLSHLEDPTSHTAHEKVPVPTGS